MILNNFFHTYVFQYARVLKKAISIFLVFLLLFNALGFYGLLRGLQFKSTLDLVERLDNHKYSINETITIKVPLAIPYQLLSGEYQRVDGEIEYNSESYRLVKQKMDKDTLFIVCIKDQTSTRINQALTDYVKTFTDKPIQAKNAGKTFVGFIKDFLLTSINVSQFSEGWNYSVARVTRSDEFDNRYLVVFTPPPQSC